MIALTAWNTDIKSAPHGRYLIKQRREGVDQRVCSIAGCGKPLRARGWCNGHWTRWNRHGDPLAGGTSPGERLSFLCEVVYPHEGKDCFIWPYGLTGAGYAHVVVDGRYVYAHRLACENRNGPAPTPKHEAAHNCGNGHLGCVNPFHLEWKTRTANRGDMVAHGTVVQGEKHGNAKLTEPEVNRIRALAKDLSQADLAKMFGVSTGAIQKIITGENWRYLLGKGEAPDAWIPWPEPYSLPKPRGDESPEAAIPVLSSGVPIRAGAA